MPVDGQQWNAHLQRSEKLIGVDELSKTAKWSHPAREGPCLDVHWPLQKTQTSPFHAKLSAYCKQSFQKRPLSYHYE